MFSGGAVSRGACCSIGVIDNGRVDVVDNGHRRVGVVIVSVKLIRF